MAERIVYTKWVCTVCGSDDVESKMWENHKTGELSDCGFDDDDNWCNKCEEHVGLDTKELTFQEYAEYLRDRPKFGKALESLKLCLEYMGEKNLPKEELAFRKQLLKLCNEIAIKHGGCISTRQF